MAFNMKSANLLLVKTPQKIHIMKHESLTDRELGTTEFFGISQPPASTNTRDLSRLDILAIGWNICNSWGASVATLAISISSGGPVTLIYGLILIFVLAGSCALSMAEIASVYPTSSGQYHWTGILAPMQYKRGLSYVCGSLNFFGWIANTAGFIIPLPQMVVALVQMWRPDYSPKNWHIFFIFEVTNIIFVFHNIYIAKRALWLNEFGFGLSITSFLVIFVTCLALSSPKQPSSFVWTTFINNSSWSSNGIVFLTGLVNPNFILSGLDGAIHMAEECLHPTRDVPRALISTVTIGFVTSFAFAIAMTYSYHDFEAVLSSSFPALEIWYQATASRACASTFLMAILVTSLFAITGSQLTASRLTWAFARDNAILGSSKLSIIHPTLHVPVTSLLLNGSVVGVLGCLYLGSTTAFNSLVATGLVLGQISYAIPVALLLQSRFRRDGTWERLMPRKRSFTLPMGVGIVVNGLTVAFGLISLVFYCLPVDLPVTADNMNYTCVILSAFGTLSSINWIVKARHGYRMP